MPVAAIAEVPAEKPALPGEVVVGAAAPSSLGQIRS
jgi:hypothetical protein